MILGQAKMMIKDFVGCMLKEVYCDKELQNCMQMRNMAKKYFINFKAEYHR